MKHDVIPLILLLRNLSLSAILMTSSEMLFRISFYFGGQHYRYEMLTKAAQVQHILKNTWRTSCRNSNLWFSSMHRFPSVTSHNLSHTHDIWVIYWRWWWQLRRPASKLSRVHHRSFYAPHKPETFLFAVSQYSLHYMVNVSTGDLCSKTQNLFNIIIIIIIFINCNWVVTQWQWLFYMYTKYEIGYYWI